MFKREEDQEEKYESYLKENRKDGKIQRKKAETKDRSKFKKTDQAKYLTGLKKEQETKLAKRDWLEGRVLSVMPQGIVVEWNGEKISCVLKGLLKKEKTHAKNLIVVGDVVLFEFTSAGEGFIGQVKPRKTVLSRADNLSRRKEQMIAANVDQVLITVSVVNPPLKPAIVDRYIIATQMGNMEPIILVNKIDFFKESMFDELLLEEQKLQFKEFLNAYSLAGIRVIPVSATTQEGLDQLRKAMYGKTSVFSGQSGVGKSSLINAITGLNLRTGGIVEKTKKGSHTTTTATLIPLEFGGWCVDTPGIKSFGVWDLKKDQIESYFTEIHECGVHCKFADCSHTHEENCAVLKGLESGNISLMRYESYQSLIEGAGDKHLRR